MKEEELSIGMKYMLLNQKSQTNIVVQPAKEEEKQPEEQKPESSSEYESEEDEEFKGFTP